MGNTPSQITNTFYHDIRAHDTTGHTRENTAKNIRATILQIEAARIAEQADKANEVAKIREEYGQLLNALSLAFESSQVFADQLGQKLFDPNAVPAGSVVNILL